MDEIRILGWWRRNDLLVELSALGCKHSLHAPLTRGLRVSLRDVSTYSPELMQKVADALIRNGFREVAEGLWAAKGLTDDEIRQEIGGIAEDDEYKRHGQNILAVEAQHPDWSDEQIAEELSIDPLFVRDFRR